MAGLGLLNFERLKKSISVVFRFCTAFKIGAVLSVCLWSTLASTMAQTGSVRGFVYDEQNGEPILYTNVVLEDINKGTSTNENGLFVLDDVPAGKHTLRCTYIGYDTARKTIQVKGNQVTNVNLYLNESRLKLEQVEIQDSKEERINNVEISKTKVSPTDVARIPAFGGEPDFAQYLQVVPGVVFSGDQGGNFYIRGGTPVQNKVVMDGMTIFNPFHSIGLFSVFDMAYIRNADIYTGGFNAEYGNRISAIVDLQTKDGNKQYFSGEVSGSPFTSKIQVEGPIKEFEKGQGSISYLFNTRISYLNETSPGLYSYADSNGLPYQFQDFYGNVTFTGANGSSAKLFGFSFNDQVNFQGVAEYDWNATGAGTELLLLPSASSNTIKANFAFSSYDITEDRAGSPPRKSSISNFQAGLDFNYYPGDDIIKYGLDISGNRTNTEITNQVGRTISQEQFTTRLAGFGRYKKKLGDLIIDPSLRVQLFASFQEVRLEPRFSTKYNFTENFRVKAAGGLYSQDLMSSRSERDVVNLFYGFLSAPSNLPDQFNGQGVDSRLQSSRHLIAGFEADLTPNLFMEVEGYIKDFTQLTDINRNKIYSDDPENQDKPATQRKSFIVEEGQAYGIDFNARYNKTPYYFKLVYSLAYNERTGEQVSYNPHWDRRHNLNAVGTYQFGKLNNWELSLRWNLGSGFPFTQTQGFYENMRMQQNGATTNIKRQNGQLGIIYDDLNGGRLPYYHRLDASLKKAWQLSPNQKLQATLSVINTYNRNNVFYFDRVEYKRVNQLPILPSLSFSYEF